MSYTTPPQFTGAQARPPRHEIDFGILSEAFTLLFQHWQVYVIPGVIMMLLNLPGFIISVVPTIQSMMGNEPSVNSQLATAGIQMLLALGAGLISIFLYPGIVLYTFNVVLGRPASTADLWVGFRDPLGFFAVIFLAGLIYVLGVFACCIGVIFTGGLMMFALPHKVATGQTATQSITRSFELLKPFWPLAGIFFLVVTLIVALGQVACYIGLVITIPFGYIAPTLLYCQFEGILPAPTSDPISPYPRGGASYGQNIGEQPRQKPEGEPPPKPDDYS